MSFIHEGGFAPALKADADAVEMIPKAIEMARKADVGE